MVAGLYANPEVDDAEHLRCTIGQGREPGNRTVVTRGDADHYGKVPCKRCAAAHLRLTP